jgi:hypothetical protein
MAAFLVFLSERSRNTLFAQSVVISAAEVPAMRDDDDTPVHVPIVEFEIDALRIQLADLRKEHELWRPVVETAKILAQRWVDNAGDWSPQVIDAVDMVFRMVNAAESAKGE